MMSSHCSLPPPLCLLSPFPCPLSILPHHPHLLLFLFGSDVAMVALNVGGIQHMGSSGDMAVVMDDTGGGGGGDVAVSMVDVGRLLLLLLMTRQWWQWR